MKTANHLIKICGLTRLEDCRAALQAGVDAVGLVLTQSKRQVTLPQARLLLEELGRGVFKVAVTRQGDPFRAGQLQDLGFDIWQVHDGTLSTEQLDVDFPCWRALRPQDWSSFAGIQSPYMATVLDGAVAGSGHSWDWAVLQQGPSQREVLEPFILAGGLDPDNVAQAISCLRPWGVDVSSGVEDAAGIKSATKMQSFVDQARRAWAEVG